MQTKKLLGIALAASLVASVATTAAISVNAAGISDVSDIKKHTVGIVGSFNDWGKNPDTVMTDDDGDGVFEGTVDIPVVTADMISEATMDDGNGNQIPRGKTGVTFKIRLDADWTDSWGDYEAAYVRTWNSQTNCVVEATEGESLKIKVTLDTTKNCEECIEAGEVEADDDVDYTLIPVRYSVVTDDSGEAGETGDTDETPDEPIVIDEPSVEEVSDSGSASDSGSGEVSDSGSGEVSVPEINSDYHTQIKDYVFFDNSETKWDEVYAYWWHPDYERTYDLENNDHGCVVVVGEDGTEGYEPTKFPGTRMEQVKDADGNPTDIWQIRIPFNAQKIIFSSGKSDDEVKNGETGYQTVDLDFNETENAGKIYRIDTSVEPKAGRGVEKTKYKYSAGSWEDYDGEFNSEYIGNMETPDEPTEETPDEPTEESSEDSKVDPEISVDPYETPDEPTEESSEEVSEEEVSEEESLNPEDSSEPEGSVDDETSNTSGNPETSKDGEGTTTVETQDQPENSNTSGNADNTGSNSSTSGGSYTDAPATGDAAMAVAFIAVITAALGAVVLATKKKRI